MDHNLKLAEEAAQNSANRIASSVESTTFIPNSLFKGAVGMGLSAVFMIYAAVKFNQAGTESLEHNREEIYSTVQRMIETGIEESKAVKK